MKNACNYQNVNRGRLVAAWIWNVVSARPDGLERGRKTSVNPAALYRRASDLGLDSGFINRTARHYFPDLDLRANVWKIPRRPEFRLFEKEADGELGRAFNDWAYFLFMKEGRVPVSTFKDYAKQIGVDFRTLRQTARALRLDTIQGDDGKYYWVRRDRFAFSDVVGIVAGKLYESRFENNPNKFLFTPQKIVRIEELPDVPSTRLIVDAALNRLLAEGLAKTHIFFDATANKDREGFY
ncbi:MAG: hypothetical protein J6K25_10980 [Thermoguttaceae bacterium]|nr:hypothetical protein [Thermoguttaceae bacterium]